MSLANKQRGFTLVELIIALTLTSLIATILLGFFGNSYIGYTNLQTDAFKFSDLAVQSQRVTKVLRGATDVLEATSTSVTVYAYFTPRDAYVSKIRYYYDSTTSQLKAEMTPMSAMPPSGTPITSQKVSYTIMSNFYKASGVNVFEYLDAVGVNLGTVTNLRDIKSIRVTLAVPPTTTTTTKSTTIVSEVALRNRKTNL